MHLTSCIIMAAVITEPSICIPRTLYNVNWRQVKDAFEQVIGRGTVERVDIVPSKNNEAQPFCRIFVHFRYWPNTPDIMAIRQRLIDGEMIKVVYDNPWFWKCAASRIAKPERNQPKTAPYIEYTGGVVTPTCTTEKPTPPPLVRSPRVTARSPSPSPLRRTRSQLGVARQPKFDDKSEHEGEGQEEVGETFSDA